MGHGPEGILTDGVPSLNDGREKMILPGGAKSWLNSIGCCVRFLKEASFRKNYSSISIIYTNFIRFVNGMLRKIKEKGEKTPATAGMAI